MAGSKKQITLLAEANPEFVETEYVNELTERSLIYLQAGFPVHFRGPAGTGKSTLAKHVASKLARPICLIHGDEQMTTANLIGGESGYSMRKVRDNFISTVLKEEESMTKRWVDSRLTQACRYGYTLVYDEFTRSRPEANNVLLSVLQDKMLTISNDMSGESPYLEVSPQFKAIFTSNPEEYAGTHKSQDALRDRMVTIDIDYPDYITEVQILRAKSLLPLDSCELITKIVRTLRDSGACEFSPTIRGGIMIAKTLSQINILPEDNVPLFTKFCQDILASETSRLGKKTNQSIVKGLVKEIIGKNISRFSTSVAS
jgi:gas vesicle protein GvpN